MKLRHPNSKPLVDVRLPAEHPDGFGAEQPDGFYNPQPHGLYDAQPDDEKVRKKLSEQPGSNLEVPDEVRTERSFARLTPRSNREAADADKSDDLREPEELADESDRRGGRQGSPHRGSR